MNKGFTKLEIILGGVVLFFIISFLVTKKLNLSVSKETQLRQRYNQYISLLNSGNYSEAYNYFSSSTKNDESLGDYIKSAKESKNVGKQTVTINNIVIRGNNGYVDRTNTVCEDNNCSSKKVLIGYKKWVFENGNWYVTTEDVGCIRETPYEKPPEFDRALSLIKQRLNDLSLKMNSKEMNFSYFNCLDIKYSDLKEEEGLFTFDPKDSSLDKLQILVNSSYKEKDDILTAFLLTHEVTHAALFLNTVNFGEEIGCIDNEINAFSMQLSFIQSLNPEEANSINQRLKSGYYRLSPPLQMTWDLLVMSNKANTYCGKNAQSCYDDRVKKDLNSKIINNPYYQKQCSLN